MEKKNSGLNHTTQQLFNNAFSLVYIQLHIILLANNRKNIIAVTTFYWVNQEHCVRNVHSFLFLYKIIALTSEKK